jgi:hypothetical protein
MKKIELAVDEVSKEASPIQGQVQEHSDATTEDHELQHDINTSPIAAFKDCQECL